MASRSPPCTPVVLTLDQIEPGSTPRCTPKEVVLTDRRRTLAGTEMDSFVTAAFVGDLSQIKRELETLQSKVDAISPLEAALQAAAESGHTDVCDYLLTIHANPNQQDSRCWTPLHHAASRGHLGVARVLLEHGAFAMARASREVHTKTAVSRWLLFCQNVLCGPTPRQCAANSALRDLLREHERRQWWACCCRPLPLRNWRRELRLRDEATDEPCCGRVGCWVRVRRVRRKAGYKKTEGLGFGGGVEMGNPGRVEDPPPPWVKPAAGEL
eukprot:CAMPEP_0181177812 /NCGR_PEP_ID=MMETSP1096-20121128/5372_1 /TAXON_ID=156174 ORGANISM="Chrysochromulina ericina, Strain CCMP281" /NCGR_SAMPLE_ID=MMETSP1096 /ASSEMBLY_ACC=CAM_ASM_000453 /LENGTH=269 /DNA_ID=CAMNT_0023266011 /DNA_START=35 /DNA_END=844 /DNA_ORIENTATION=+